MPAALSSAVEWPVNWASLPCVFITLVGSYKDMINQSVVLGRTIGGRRPPRLRVEVNQPQVLNKVHHLFRVGMRSASVLCYIRVPDSGGAGFGL